MKSVTLLKKSKNTIQARKDEDIVILPFHDSDDDMEQLLKEMEEDQKLAYENQALGLMAELKKINQIRFTELPRVA